MRVWFSCTFGNEQSSHTTPRVIIDNFRDFVHTKYVYILNINSTKVIFSVIKDTKQQLWTNV